MKGIEVFIGLAKALAFPFKRNFAPCIEELQYFRQNKKKKLMTLKSIIYHPTARRLKKYQLLYQPNKLTGTSGKEVPCFFPILFAFANTLLLDS